ncbi:MAG: hypothetical protein DRP97_02525 [Candidatus Latescibacterota bacterium]|nr:MAG: hypothetical protein B1H02_01425 [Candidatus Latescibacteria bacterium 4484_107]RKY71164.1 MAG: hypothetical protein DRP97_02525 [Candidatus Latescibacterota bacterium]
MLAVKGLYDGKKIQPLEPIATAEPYVVVITFIEPVSKKYEDEILREAENREDENSRRFWASFGSWEDDRTAEEIIEDIYSSRKSSGKEVVL